MAQREHKLTKPPINGIALILPEPLHDFYKDNDKEDATETTAISSICNTSATTKPPERFDEFMHKYPDPLLSKNNKQPSSMLCMLPQWRRGGRRITLRPRKNKRTPKATKISPDTGSMRLLENNKDRSGEWS